MTTLTVHQIAYDTKILAGHIIACTCGRTISERDYTAALGEFYIHSRGWK